MMSTIINNNSLQAEESFDFLFKIVLIGDCGTGKTCVVQRFRTGTFMERQGSTIGVDFSMKTIVLDGKKIKVSSGPLIVLINLTKDIELLCART